MRRNLWVRLPAEDPRSTERGVCARLLRSLYGTRDAGQHFELFTTETMQGLGFTGGIWSPCLFQSDTM